MRINNERIRLGELGYRDLLKIEEEAVKSQPHNSFASFTPLSRFGLSDKSPQDIKPGTSGE